MTPTRWLSTLLLLIVAILLSLFTIQNSSRVVDLSMDLGIYAVHLAEPQPVSLVLWVVFGCGLLLGGGWGIVGRMRAGRRIRQLEQEVARANLGAPTDDAWT